MFDRKRPCKTCPFRVDSGGLRYLGRTRAEEIAECIGELDQIFTCHDDLGKPESQRQHCVGAMLVLEKANNPNQMMRIGERLGFYDRHSLIGHDEVFNTLEEWVDIQARLR